jgi:thiol-disulfide isomerase/thioredoxin
MSAAVLLSSPACADAFLLGLDDGNEINVEVSPADGDLLMIWVVDHDQSRPQFERMLKRINAAGIELWRVDLLADYFLPRSSENVRTLSGEGIAAVIEAAHRRSDKTLLLASYDRMPLPLLRGVRSWSQQHDARDRLAGSILYYPNLFGPPPVAGQEPELDPVVAASNYPLVVVQPAQGSQRWRLSQVMEAFWRAGAPAHAQILEGVRDWFFMHRPGEDPIEDRATAAIPAQIRQLAKLLQAADKPERALPVAQSTPQAAKIQELVPFDEPRPAAGLDLPDIAGNHTFTGFGGKVTLVSFWATWCPPCVEEVPSLNNLKKHYSERPFALISVDFRESVEAVEKFKKRIDVEFPVLMDSDGRASLDWGVFSFPSSFLIDKNGAIRFSINRAIDWDTPQVHAIIDSLLDEI